LTGDLKNIAQLYDLEGNPIFQVQIFSENKTGGAAIRSIAFSPDGRSFCLGAEGGLAQVFRIVKDEPVPAFALQHYPRLSILSVVFSADGKQVLTGSNDGYGRIWEVY